MMRFFRNVPSRLDSECSSLNGLSAWWRRVWPVLGRRVALGGALEHLATVPLTPQSSLVLVRLHHETLLLGITPQRITLLSKEREATAGSDKDRADETGDPQSRRSLAEFAKP